MALTLANRITVFRILLVPFFIVTILYYSPDKDHLRFYALGIFLLAAISDAFDGFLARVYDQKTPIGAILDPVADKMLLISAFICLYKVSVLFEKVRFPIWLVVAVISRDVLILVGITIIRLFHGEIKIDPNRWGKVTTFLEILCIIAILLQWRFSPYLWWTTLIVAGISTVIYIKTGIKILGNGDKKP